MSDPQPSDSQSSDSQPSDSQPSDSQPPDLQPSDSQPSDSQPHPAQATPQDALGPRLDLAALDLGDAVQPLNQAELDAFEQFPDLPPSRQGWWLGGLGLVLLGLGLGGWRLWHGHWDPRCDRAYALCIPSPPPSLTCDQVPAQNFRVYLPDRPDKPWGLRQFDPHGFDLDGDGYGCEEGGPLAQNL
ncbi:MAG: hypothetical protein ACO35Q_02150 [Prochlorothrix sp.]